MSAKPPAKSPADDSALSDEKRLVEDPVVTVEPTQLELSPNDVLQDETAIFDDTPEEVESDVPSKPRGEWVIDDEELERDPRVSIGLFIALAAMIGFIVFYFVTGMHKP